MESKYDISLARAPVERVTKREERECVCVCETDRQTDRQSE